MPSWGFLIPLRRTIFSIAAGLVAVPAVLCTLCPTALDLRKPFEDWLRSHLCLTPKPKNEPERLFAAIVVQAIQWAWSHAQRMKHTGDAEPISINAAHQPGYAQRAAPPPDSAASRRARSHRESPVRRLSMSCQRYTAEVARRICQSVDGFQHVPSANLSCDGSPVSYRLLDDSHDTLADHDASITDCFQMSPGEVSKLRRMWRRQMFEDAQTGT